MEKKVLFVDYVKGIAIILMVLLHSSRWIESGYVGHLVCLFHMPIFFVVSGFCFKQKYINDHKGFLIKRIRGLWYPYVKFGLLFLVLHNIFYYMHIYDSHYGSYTGVTSKLYSISDYLLQFQRVIRMVGTEQLLGGYWFLHALFYASIISFIVIKYSRGRIILGGVLLILSMVFAYFEIIIPFWGVDSKAVLGSFFFFMGYTLRNNKKIWSVSSNKYFYLLTLLFVPFVAWFLPSSMPTMSFEKIIPYTISALLASASLLTLTSRINMNSSKIHHFINYVGSHTLSILTWHFLSFKVVSLIIIMIYDLPIQQLAYYPSIQEFSTRGWWLAYTIAGVIMPLCLFLIYKRLKTYQNAHL